MYTGGLLGGDNVFLKVAEGPDQDSPESSPQLSLLFFALSEVPGRSSLVQFTVPMTHAQCVLQLKPSLEFWY